MLNNNFINLVKSLTCYNNDNDVPITVININGTVLGDHIPEAQRNSNRLDYNFGAHTLEYLNKTAGGSIFVGTGQREESEEDIALESIVPDSDLKHNNSSFIFTDGKFLFTKTFTYIGANDITITEVAFYKTVYSYGNDFYYTCCLARQKIEPLTVSNGDTFTVTMVIG